MPAAALVRFHCWLKYVSVGRAVMPVGGWRTGASIVTVLMTVLEGGGDGEGEGDGPGDPEPEPFLAKDSAPSLEPGVRSSAGDERSASPRRGERAAAYCLSNCAA